MKKLLFLPSNFYLILGFLFFQNSHIIAQTLLERVDSTISKVVNPQKDLRLWYGVDEFPIHDFVVLPKYTIICNEKSSTLRLISNENRLVIDEFDLLSLKNIKLHNIRTVEGKNLKSAINRFQSWFTMIDDNTILAGTILFKDKDDVSGYLKIHIENEKMSVETQKYDIKEGEIDSGFSRKNMERNYITNMYSVGEYTIFTTPEWFKYVNNEKQCSLNRVVYLKKKGDGMKKLYEVPCTKGSIPNANSLQLFRQNGDINIYDNTSKKLLVYDNDFTEKRRFDFEKITKLELNPKSILGDFFVDNVNNELYYHTGFRENEVFTHSIFKAKINADNIDFEKLQESNSTDYIYKFINNKMVFVINVKNHFIYTFNLN